MKIADKLLNLVGVGRERGLPPPRLVAIADGLLVTERSDASREAIASHAREIGLPELFLPRQIVTVKSLPLLGSGKADYGAVTKLAAGAIASPPESVSAGALHS